MSIKPLLDVCDALEREYVDRERVEIAETRVLRVCPGHLRQAVRDLAKAAVRVVDCRRRGDVDYKYMLAMRLFRRELEELASVTLAS